MNSDKDELLPKLEEIKELLDHHYEIVLKCCELEENLYNRIFHTSEADEAYYKKFMKFKQICQEYDIILKEQTDNLILQYTITGDMPLKSELEGFETIII